MWIDTHYNPTNVGDVGFLIESTNNGYGGSVTTHYMQEEPGRTNMSHEPRLHGWLGETNNISKHAKGMARVTRVSKNGGRAFVVAIRDSELHAALEAAGHPDLCPTNEVRS